MEGQNQQPISQLVARTQGLHAQFWGDTTQKGDSIKGKVGTEAGKYLTKHHRHKRHTVGYKAAFSNTVIY